MNTRLMSVAFAAGILSGACVWSLWPHEPSRQSSNELMDAVMWGREPIGGPFTLIDQSGNRRADTDFRGKLLLIYFGFSYCSDICPVDLQSMGAAIDQLGPAGDDVQPLFITINPEVDTPDELQAYVSLFHPRLIGLTGSSREIRRVASAYKVYSERSQPLRRTDPNFDHSGLIYLLDKQGGYAGYFPPSTSPERIATVLRRQLGIVERSE